jgi:ribosomal protein S7
MALVARTSAAAPMKDYLAQIEKLRRDAAECALIRDLATDKAKREMFDRLANHLTVLADQVEMAMIERKSDANTA